MFDVIGELKLLTKQDFPCLHVDISSFLEFNELSLGW